MHWARNRVTYDIENDLVVRLTQKGENDEATMFPIKAYEGRRELLGEEAKVTLASLMNLGVNNQNMGDYQAALECYERSLRVEEKQLGKTHRSTLMTLMNMATMYMEGLMDYPKAQEMYKSALNGYERSLGNEHKDTKICARNLNVFLEKTGIFDEK